MLIVILLLKLLLKYRAACSNDSFQCGIILFHPHRMKCIDIGYVENIRVPLEQ